MSKKPIITKEDCATPDPKNGYVIVRKLLDPIAEFSESQYFETTTDQDVLEINQEIKLKKFIKKVSIMKLLTIFIEYPYLRILVGESEAKNKVNELKLFLSFTFNKIDYPTFCKKYTNLIKEMENNYL